ncbi:MAG: poly-gamma-glutamate system protein [Clostridiales bacterium]|nr:poly-gamma-glutamate system protein [Clostridiales bacterium]
MKPFYSPSSPLSKKCLALALCVSLLGIFLTFFSETNLPYPYKEVQLAAAKQTALAQEAVLSYVKAEGIPIEPDDLNQTGLIGPEWTELTSSLGLLEAKRTSLQPDFAALIVKYFHQAGLTKGDTVLCGMSGSFPSLCLAAVCAANQMGLEIKVIVSYGSSMYGATRLKLSVLRILEIAKNEGILEYTLLAASPGGDFDQGNSTLFPNARKDIFALAKEDQVLMIDEPDIPSSVQRRLALYGDTYDCFLNIGGASVNVGTSPYTLQFPNGLVTDPPRIPQDSDRGLTYEYAARNIPVIHLLSIRDLAEDNGLPYDPVPLTKPGETKVYYTTYHSPWYALGGLFIACFILVMGKKSSRKKKKLTTFSS